MPKESQNVDKRCTFSSLISSYHHLYAMNENSKPHLCVEQLIVSDLIVCGASYNTWAALSCDMRPHKQTLFFQSGSFAGRVDRVFLVG